MKNYKATIDITEAMPEDDGSEFVLKTRKQLRWMKIKVAIVLISFLPGVIILYTNLMIKAGAMKERMDKECVSPSSIKHWENVLSAVMEICVESPGALLDKIELMYDKQIIELEAEVKQWKANYIWALKQNKKKVGD